MAKVKQKAIAKKGRSALKPARGLSRLRWMPQTPSFWVVSIMLFASGTVAMIQGGIWIALVIYVVNLLTLLWHHRE
jgi:uncharacterized membrane protein YjjP (DUF1212 family)